MPTEAVARESVFRVWHRPNANRPLTSKFRRSFRSTTRDFQLAPENTLNIEFVSTTRDGVHEKHISEKYKGRNIADRLSPAGMVCTALCTDKHTYAQIKMTGYPVDYFLTNRVRFANQSG